MAREYIDGTTLEGIAKTRAQANITQFLDGLDARYVSIPEKYAATRSSGRHGNPRVARSGSRSNGKRIRDI